MEKTFSIEENDGSFEIRGYKGKQGLFVLQPFDPFTGEPFADIGSAKEYVKQTYRFDLERDVEEEKSIVIKDSLPAEVTEEPTGDSEAE
jgi:hypothetical protein